MNGGWEDGFWDDDEAMSAPLEEAEESLKERLVEDRITAFGKLLAEVFPKGSPEQSLGRGPQTVATSIGDHWVGIVGATKPGDNEFTWDGFWRQNVEQAIGRKRPEGRRRGGATIEKATRPIKSDTGAAGWLSWVHRNICKVAVETLRVALHPDNFMPDLAKTFRAAYDLERIGASWRDVEDLMTQRLPWKPNAANNGALCTLFRHDDGATSVKIGGLGVQLKGDHWRYGGKVQIDQLNPIFIDLLRPNLLKFAHEATVKACKTMDEAIERAEKLYALKLFEWLTGHSTNEGLRTAA